MKQLEEKYKIGMSIEQRHPKIYKNAQDDFLAK